jgi:D-alanyl-lipoteichoic acid acyltransferase DltB (MBOAT superfamily)
MLFHTWLFVAFFAVVYPGHLATRGTRFNKYLLLGASYCFYGAWNPAYLLLILWSTALDWLAVTRMDRSKHPASRRTWLILSIVNNLSVLCLFKYAGFLAANLNTLLAWLGASAWRLPDPASLQLPLLGRIVLPVGISFYTFQSMSYSIDFYRGQIPRERSFIRYAAFVSLFPQLVAGPIERAKNLLPQLRGRPPITTRDITDGLSLFLVGLFKKVALADYFGLYVASVFPNPDQHLAPALILATLAFGWQIYFDFSGYTDMARGVGRMMGFRFMLNFRNPYLATGLGDFWRRWHISLSTWFRDYVYIPMGGNRRGRVLTYVFMALTMLISGLWHGAAWTFLIWGALHALGRVCTRALERTELYRQRFPRIAKVLLVYLFVNFAWIFFAVQGNLDNALTICRRIFTAWSPGGHLKLDPRMPIQMLLLMAAVWAYQFAYESKLRRVLASGPVRVAMVVGMVAYLLLFPSRGEPFIYFQF